MQPSILLLGGGRMGAAMLTGWRRAGLGPSYVVDPAPGAAGLGGGPVSVVARAADIPGGFRPDAVVLAVKPQSAADAVPPVAAFTAGSRRHVGDGRADDRQSVTGLTGAGGHSGNAEHAGRDRRGLHRRLCRSEA